MRKTIISTIAAALFITGFLSPADAIPIDVFQGGIFLGTIESYTSADPYSPITSVENYNYNPNRVNVINGPSKTEKQGQFFFFEGSDGLSFNNVFGGIGDNTTSWVDLDILVEGSTLDPSVLFSDDPYPPVELQEVDNSNSFEARFVYWQSYGDGGVIGAIDGDWTITVDPLRYENLNTLVAFGSYGTEIALTLDLTEDIVFTTSAHNVPEPATITLLLFGIIGLAVARRKK